MKSRASESIRGDSPEVVLAPEASIDKSINKTQAKKPKNKISTEEKEFTTYKKGTVKKNRYKEAEYKISILRKRLRKIPQLKRRL